MDISLHSGLWHKTDTTEYRGVQFYRKFCDRPTVRCNDNGMAPDEINLATMAETLAKSADYRVLRRLLPRAEFASCDGQATKTGILLDVETTGLDAGRDEVIELAMVKFTYLPDGRIARIVDVFSSFNEPSNPIPAEITDLTEITRTSSQRSWKTPLLSLLTTRTSIANSPSVIGRFSNKSRGDVRQQKWNGASMDSMDRG